MRVIETSIDEDLSLFSQYLWQRRITHRVFEERGRQVLELDDPGDGETVRSAYAALSDGRLVLEAPPRVVRRFQILRLLRGYPGLTALIGVAAVLYPFTAPLAEGRLTAVAAGLTIVNLGSNPQVAPGFIELLAGLQVWRWFLPVFIHFSVLHLVFNCAIVIDLGRRIEHEFGSWRLLLVVVVLGLVSNLGQYAMNPNPVFGGLSGVAYGLLGFMLVMARLNPERSIWHLPPGLSGSLLFFLVLFSTGVTEGFGLFVANSAHWFGLATGAVMALVCTRVIRAGH
ncbi:MAG: rhomboid family intramembrane serine protease [Pseudomonadales bacterium]|jgi:GlpG protein